MARNIEDYDLFMDLFNVTKVDEKLFALATEAFHQAETVLNQNDSTTGTSNLTPGDTNSMSSCSHSSCSECIPAHQQKIKGEQKNSRSNCSHSIKSTATMSGTTQTLIVKRFQKNRQQMQPENDSLGNSHMKNYVPPLPYFKSKVFNAENIKINIPKPELRTGSGMGLTGIADSVQGNYLKAQHHHKTPAPPPLPDVKKKGRHYRAGNGGEKQHISSQSYADPASLNMNTSNFRNSIACTGQSPFTYSNGGGDNYHNLDRGMAFPQPQNQMSGLWSKIPDQTLGIPLAATSSTTASSYASKPPLSSLLSASSYGLLPRASTSFSNSYLHLPNNNPHQHPQSINNNNSFQLMKSESLHNLPKFYQHPLVSGTIPSVPSAMPAVATLAHSTDDLALRAARKPATSILSNSSSNVSGAQGNVNSSGATNGNSNNPTQQTKRDPGEKNKVKFSDTVQVAVVPVGKYVLCVKFLGGGAWAFILMPFLTISKNTSFKNLFFKTIPLTTEP